LRVPERFQGHAGRCTHCQARIALLGSGAGEAPLRATLVADRGQAVPESPASHGPATDKQRDYLRALGVTENEIALLDRAAASERIDAIRAAQQNVAPPTARQLAYLHKLGATAAQRAALRSRAEASRLIDALVQQRDTGRRGEGAGPARR